EPPRESQRIVNLSGWVRRNRWGRGNPSEEACCLPPINQQTQRHSLAQHPFQADFGESAFRLSVGASYVRMYACKPDLLNALTWQLRPPEIIPEIATPFIDRDSMTTIHHIRVLGCVR